VETAADVAPPTRTGRSGSGGLDQRTPPPGRSNRPVPTWLIVLAVISLIAVVSSYAAIRDGSDPRVEGGVAEVDTPLPDIEGEGVSGGPVSIGDQAGQVTVVNVWATWCEPCKREQPALRSLAKRYRDRGVAFVGINYRDDQAKARTWIEDFHVPYPSVYDPNGQIAAQLGFPFLPDTYVVDSGGTIRYAVYGETDEAELSGLIGQVLGGSTG
jgi:cytochrome c biogenesis protein CcmG, thiol:disulfide interchange protein DsbE